MEKPKKRGAKSKKKYILMYRLLQKHEFDQRAAVEEFAELNDCTIVNAYYHLGVVKKKIKASNIYDEMVTEFLQTSNRATKAALKKAMEDGDFLEFERCAKLQLEALGLGTKHNVTNVLNQQQQNNILNAPTEEILAFVRESQANFGTLLAGAAGTGGTQDNRPVELLPAESGRSDAVSPFNVKGKMGTRGKS